MKRVIKVINKKIADTGENNFLVTIATTNRRTGKIRNACFHKCDWFKLKSFIESSSDDGTIIVRRFENEIDEDNGIPYKTVCGFKCQSDGVFPLSQEMMYYIHCLDENMEYLPPEISVRCVDAIDMFPEFSRKNSVYFPMMMDNHNDL